MRVSSKALIAVAGTALSLAAAPPLGQLKLGPESRIWVAGKSTVKDFRCTAKTLDANIVSPATEPAKVEIAKLVSAASVAIAVEQLDCANGTMNEHMRKALNAKQFSRIEFKMSSYDIVKNDVTVKGLLTINGQEQAVALVGKAADEEGMVRTSATAQIDMTKWGVKPPSLMMGTMKVKPVVTIGYDVSVVR